MGVRMDESQSPFALCSQINTESMKLRKAAVCVPILVYELCVLCGRLKYFAWQNRRRGIV